MCGRGCRDDRRSSVVDLGRRRLVARLNFDHASRLANSYSWAAASALRAHFPCDVHIAESVPC
jgi:hypothetical protein